MLPLVLLLQVRCPTKLRSWPTSNHKMLSSVKIKALSQKAFKCLYGKTESRTETCHIILILKALLAALVHNVHLPFSFTSEGQLGKHPPRDSRPLWRKERNWKSLVKPDVNTPSRENKKTMFLPSFSVAGALGLPFPSTEPYKSSAPRKDSAQLENPAKSPAHRQHPACRALTHPFCNRLSFESTDRIAEGKSTGTMSQ